MHCSFKSMRRATEFLLCNQYVGFPLRLLWRAGAPPWCGLKSACTKSVHRNNVSLDTLPTRHSQRPVMKPDSVFPPADFLSNIAQKLGEVLKNSPAKDIETNIKAALSAMFSKLDMVSREEFDVQSAVLTRTREKLALLEARITELEKKQGTPQ